MTLSSSIDVSNVSITSGQRTRRKLITEGEFKSVMDETIRDVVKGSLNVNQTLTSVITTDIKQYVIGTVPGTTAVSQLVFEEKCTSSCTEQLQTTTLGRTVISYMNKEVQNGNFTTILRENAADDGLGLDDIQNATVVSGTFNETGTSVATSSPTKMPTSVPTAQPSQQPTTKSPTASPTTASPTQSPTESPTASPPASPTTTGR